MSTHSDAYTISEAVMTRAEYQRYLQSPEWRATRQRRLTAAGNRCEFCQDMGHHKGDWHGPRCTATDDLNVHHLHYDSLGAEQDTDLEVLCRFHHLVRHASNYECPTCCDAWSIPDDDAIEAVERAMEAAGGDIAEVTPEQVLDFINCSYCIR